MTACLSPCSTCLSSSQALVLACMDARLHPEKSLGLSIGDCHCVRNAGGRASEDALRSIAISQRLLGEGPGYSLYHTAVAESIQL